MESFGAVDTDADVLLRECFKDQPWSDEALEALRSLEEFVVDSEFSGTLSWAEGSTYDYNRKLNVRRQFLDP